MIDKETYVPSKLVKDIHPGAIDGNGNRLFLPGFIVDGQNFHIKTTEGGGYGSVESVRSDIIRSYALPTGDNKTIGSIFNTRDNTIIYFIANSLDNDMILEYVIDEKAFRLLIQSNLSFDSNNLIFQKGIINDHLFWLDALNLRQINFVRARQGQYANPILEEELTHIKKPPIKAPLVKKVTNSSLSFNYISDNNYQFFLRYVYLDNQRSVFSTLSKLMVASFFPDLFDKTKNEIEVSFDFDLNLQGIVIAIEVGYRIGNEGDYNIFHTIKNPDQESYQIPFRGKQKSVTVPTSEELHYFENIGRSPGALAIIENSVVVERGNFGFDFSSYSATLSATPVVSLSSNGEAFFKENSVISLGIIYRDDFGRVSFVKSETQVSIPTYPAIKNEAGAYYSVGNQRQYLRWEITGSPPPEATSYQIVLKKDSFYSIYQQYQVNCFFYFGVERESGEVGEGEVVIEGKIFLKAPSESLTRSIYLSFPINGAFVPDTDCKIRVLSADYKGDSFIDIVKIDGSFIVIDIPFAYDPINRAKTENVSTFPKQLFIEVFKPSRVEDTRFYEYSQVFSIVNGEFSIIEGNLFGDTYRISAEKEENKRFQFLYPNFFDEAIQGSTFVQGRAVGQVVIESPTPTLSQIASDVEDLTSQNLIVAGTNEDGRTILKGTSRSTQFGRKFNNVNFNTGFVLDYTKADGDYGRPFIVNDREMKQSNRNIVSYSNKYVNESYINGSNTFLAENQYILPVERSAIRGFFKVNNVLLSLHEREVTSLYIGEGLVREANNFILAKTEAFIGDDRVLQMDFGCINPESAIVVYGYLFYWSAYKGAFVRYSSEGLFPVSDYDNKQYFYNKGKLYAPYRDEAKIITGFDEDNDEVFLTFPTIKRNGIVLIQGETIGFNIKENIWTSPYTFVPENYVSANKKLYSFNSGQLREHESGGDYNVFYGVKTKREFTVVMNKFPEKNKRLLNIHIKADKLSSDPTEKVVVITTPEGQETYLRAGEFTKEEGVWVSEIFKDVNTPTEFLGLNEIALRSGADLVSHYFFIKVINSQQTNSRLEYVSVVFKIEEFSL